MRRVPVESEAIRSVDYDFDARLLEIEFHSGAIYRYFDVPAGVHLALMQAASLGEAFARLVRNAGFEYSQARPPDQ